MTDDQEAAARAEQDAATAAEDLAVEVHYPPVANGLDYLLSVVENLRGKQVTRRNLKYAVVHLQAAVECLLKYRLELEHWSLVFKNPGDAKRSQLEDGSLTSCTMDQTITRLTDIVGVTIAAKEAENLRKLASLRNQLQHYGRPHDTKVNRYVIEANAVNVLEFLMHFLDTELMDKMPLPADAETLRDAARARNGLAEVRGFVALAMRRLGPELDLEKPRTVQCPSCGQMALVVGNPEHARCLFCYFRREPQYAAMAYGETVLGRNDATIKGGPDPVDWCQTCHELALVCEAVTAADPSPVDLCFYCGERTPAGST